MIATSLLDSFKNGLRPVKKVTCDDWADANIVLSSENSAEPGRWNTKRTPFLREILQCLSPTSPVREIDFCKGVQIGATTSGIICMLTYVDTDPASIMYVLPTIEVCEAFSKDKLQPMIDNCDRLAKKIKSPRDRDSGNTILGKRYQGGFIVMAGANSAASLRSRSIRVLILDEVDAYVKNLDKEGSPVELAKKRTTSYGDRKKIFKLSTPLVKGQSEIESSFETTDQRYYHVPCPACNHYQPLEFEQLKWDEGKPDTARYECKDCGEKIEERHKTRMLEAGRWVALVPDLERRTRRGYHLSTLYSPYGWKSWEDIAEEYESAMLSLKSGDHNKMRVFYNTILGKTYEEGGDAPEWQLIYNRRDSYAFNKPNKHVCFITAGVDVQKDRLELEIVGWGFDKRSWSLDYRILLGDTAGTEVWDQLSKVVSEVWVAEDGLEIPLRLMAIDSGFNTTHVYNFCKRFSEQNVIPVKGQDAQTTMFSAPRSVNKTEAGKDAGRVRLFNIGVSIMKTELYGWLKLFKADEDELGPAGYCHFPQYGEGHFKGLTAEVVETTYTRGYAITKWKKMYQRNEQIDCRSYSRAAAAIAGMDRQGDAAWMRNIRDSYQKRTPVPPKPISEITLSNDEDGFWK